MKGYKFYIEDKMRFSFGYTLGQVKETFSSDQLYSAIINNLALLYPMNEGEKAIDYLLNKVLFTSMFYGIDIIDKGQDKSVKTMYFLPKPLGNIESKDRKRLDDKKEDPLLLRKKMKGVSHISLEVFRGMINCWSKKEGYFDYDLLDLETIGGKFAYASEELRKVGLEAISKSLKFIDVNTRQRVAVKRSNDASGDTYYIDALEINHVDIGKYKILPFMYFLYQGQLTKEIKTAIHLLCDEGIGGKRSIGMGQLYAAEEIELHLPEEDVVHTDGYYINLSTYYPSREEVEALLFFQLEGRDGYIYSKGGQTLRKKKIRLVKEGSLFSSKVKGQVIDVSPNEFSLNHKVYLNGRGFLLPLGGDC